MTTNDRTSSGSPEVAEAMDHLRRDKARLEARVAALERALERALEHARMVEDVIENTPSVVFVKDLAGRYCLANQHMTESTGRSKAEVLGHTDDAYLPPEQIEAIRRQDGETIAAGKAVHFEETLATAIGTRHFLTIKFPVHNTKGEVCGVGGIATDVTARKQAEEEHVRLQAQLIAAQEATLRELSTPLIPLAEDILVMPLIGTIDGTRARQILETLLDGISRQRAHTAILDLTGVRTVNAQVAEAILSAARAARLLGASVMLTGIRPEVSQSIIALGADLTGILTLGTLESGIAAALSASRRSAG